MNIQELIKQLEDMILIYGDRVLITITDGQSEYRIESINGKQCAKYFEPKDNVAEVVISICNKNGTPRTPKVLADALMEERIRGKLHSDTIFEKDIIRDVKCILDVSIRDRRPCNCGAKLREVWRESEET